MTDKDSSHNFNPKHRIIGAVVIVALTVVLVPWLLGEPKAPDDARTPEMESSVEPTATGPIGESSENKVAVTVVTPPVTPAEPVTPPPALNPPAPTAPAVSEATPKESAKPVTAPMVKESTKAPESRPVAPAQTKPVQTAKATPAAPAVKNGWVVQVGTFSNTDNANRIEQKLRSLGQPVKAERINISGGKAVRVRVGPYADKNAAVKAQDRIQKEMGIKVVVLSYP